MNPDDPQFTAYALGEFDDISPAERAEIEALLASDPTTLAEAQETQALAARLRAELPEEKAAALSAEQRAAVFGATAPAPGGEKVVRISWRKIALFSAAACILAAVGLGLLFPDMDVTRVSLGDRNSGTLSESPPITADDSARLVRPITGSERVISPMASAPAIVTTEKSGQMAQVEEVKRYFVEADAFYQTGRFDLARKRADQILTVDPANQAAWNMKEKVDRKISDYGTAAYNEARADAINRIDLAWQRPVRRFNLPSESPAYTADGIERRVAMTEQEASAPPTPLGSRPEEPMGSVGRIEKLERSNTEAYDAITENAFLAARDNPLSTFSIDVDTASYAIVRRFLNGNQRPPKGTVRIEEMLNYFTYDYPQPQGDAPFSATMEVTTCPWTPEHRLVRIGLKGREIAKDKRPASNLVFLIDVSGSMKPDNRLPLLKQSLALLVEQLGGEDQVAMVVYAGSSGTVLEPTRDKEKMLAALRQLEAGGSTNGASGLQLAYQLAEKAFIKGGTNRVILATDGDWNVGVTSQSDLLDVIAEKAKSGVFLTVLGVGMGNLKDAMMVKLAGRGNGNYAYLDTVAEARKVLVEQLSGTLVTIAKDVKIQVEFNPAQVGAYRLIGYEKRLLAKEDFNDDKKDAGEIGAGHTVTALYEVVPTGKELAMLAPAVDALKYQPASIILPPTPAAPQPAFPRLPAEPAPTDVRGYLLEGQSGGAGKGVAAPTSPSKSETVGTQAIPELLVATPAVVSRELLTLKFRYKEPEGDTSKLLEFQLTDSGKPWEQSSRDFRFAAAVAGYGMLLRDSPYKGAATWGGVAEWAQEGLGADASGYRAEFLTLIEKAKAVTPKARGRLRVLPAK